MKTIQVYWNGEPLKKIYPHATRWQVIKYRVNKFLVRVLKITILASLIAASLLLAFTMGSNYSKTYQITGNDRLPMKISEFKDNLLATLQGCEASGYKPGDAPIIFDSNKLPSIGPYQFQIATVVWYYSELYGKKITPAEAVNISLDPVAAKKLANDIIFTTGDPSIDWTNCTNKHGLKAMVATVKQLEK